MEPVDYRIAPAETQIVKAIAIVAMVFHHLFWEHPEYGAATYRIAIAGKICVALFVFLSGYGMETTFPKKINGHINTAKVFFFFLSRRYAKFLLNYWVIFFISIPIGVFCFGRTLETAYGQNANILLCFLKDFLGLQGFNSYNITWWFNELILVLWILFPFFHYAMKNIFIAVGALVFLFVNPSEALFKLEIFASCLSIYVLPFCLGIFMASHADFINKFLNRLPLKIVLCGSIIATSVLFFMRGVPLVPFFSYFRINAFLTMALTLAVISICRITNKRFLSLLYMGKHSMNIYLIHTFILSYFFGNYVYSLKYPVVMFIVVFTTSLLASIAIEFIKKKTGFIRLQNQIVFLLSRHIPR